jgi:hypothetical protein
MQRYKNINKWKEEGVKDFLQKSLAGVCARENVTKMKQITISLPYEAYPYLIAIATNLDHDNLQIYGQDIEFY